MLSSVTHSKGPLSLLTFSPVIQRTMKYPLKREKLSNLCLIPSRSERAGMEMSTVDKDSFLLSAVVWQMDKSHSNPTVVEGDFEDDSP